MARIITARFDQIIPGEDDISETYLTNVVRAILKSTPLLPIPVKEFELMKLNLDGRHRLICSYLLDQKEVPLFQADTPLDFMDGSQFPDFTKEELDDANYNIAHRWRDVETNAYHIGVKDFHEHMYNLRKRYDFMKNFATLQKYLTDRQLLEAA